MKWIEKFEGRKAKITKTVDVESSYKDMCDDLDDKSYITFDEFFESLDFDSFSKHDNKFYESGVRASRIRRPTTSRYESGYTGSFDINIKGQRINFYTCGYGPICPAGLENSASRPAYG